MDPIPDATMDFDPSKAIAMADALHATVQLDDEMEDDDDSNTDMRPGAAVDADADADAALLSPISAAAATAAAAMSISSPDPAAPTPTTTNPGAPRMTPQKERQSLTIDQRRALRRWASSQPVRPSHKACIEWFDAQYGLSISQSTVSHSLSAKYARLDDDSILYGARMRFGNWPDVEKLVLIWVTEVSNRGRNPTNDELVQKATAIFEALPRYKGEKAPNFSPGWVHRFKKRYGLLSSRKDNQMHQRRGPGGAVLSDGGGGSGHELDHFQQLVQSLPGLMDVTHDTPPEAVRDAFQRISVNVDLADCVRIRDAAIQAAVDATAAAAQQPHNMAIAAAAIAAASTPNGDAHDSSMDMDMGGSDAHADAVLQDALRLMQQNQAEAEANVESSMEASANGFHQPPLPQQHHRQMEHQTPPQQTPHRRHQQQQQQQPHPAEVPPVTPTPGPAHHLQTPAQFRPPDELKLTPIPSAGPADTAPGADRPVRCPFCLNTRMLRSVKDAVEHMSTHVVV